MLPTRCKPGRAIALLLRLAMRAVELQMQEPRVGALTPVQAFGSSFALLVRGTRIQEI